ncbi:MAG: hemolysin family protein [Acidobacteriota bacterium]|nr:hemolysin family protein [Acidobacteriota bacterium]
MEISSQLTLILLGFFLVFLNGFFVASEFSIVKVRESRIQELIQEGKWQAHRAHSLVKSMDEYLSATQLGITIASLALGWVGEPAFASLFEPLFSNFGGLSTIATHSLAATSAFLMITLLHIVLGELAPKSLAIWRADSVVRWIAAPLIWFHRVSYPLIWILNGTANAFLRFLGIAPMSASARAHSEGELRLILADSQAQGVLDLDERKMLERVFNFADRSVRQVMVPSMEVIFLDVQKSLEDNLKIARQHRHTRYPLCDGILDRMTGIIHVKDLFRHKHITENFHLESVKRPVQCVPESKDIKSLLTEFRQTKTHLAMVVDEYGATTGIVTFEDILEELVGEIQDEFDINAPPPMIRKLSDNKHIIHGRTLLTDMEYELGIKVNDEENDTVGGHVMMVLGRTAEVGDEVLVAGQLRVRVVGMKGLQITDLLCESIS